MRPPHASLRDAPAVAELFIGVFRRDVLTFYPQSRFEPVHPAARPEDVKSGPNVRLTEETETETESSATAMAIAGGERLEVSMFGVRYRLVPRCGGRFSAH